MAKSWSALGKEEKGYGARLALEFAGGLRADAAAVRAAVAQRGDALRFAAPESPRAPPLEARELG